MENKTILAVLFVILQSFQICSETISWNVRNNFRGNIYKSDNIEAVYTENIPVHYKIQKNSTLDINNSDLYLKFDRDIQNDISLNYNYIYSEFVYRDKDAFINTSAFFHRTNHRIELEGDKGTFFTPGEVLGSFSINFWIFPLKLSGDQVVFKIGAHYFNDETGRVEDQSITAFIDEGIFKCRFNNVLFSRDFNKSKSYELMSYDRVIPGRWSNIALSYDSVEGIIRIFINGVENGIAMTTEDGTRFTSPLNLFYNSKNRCVITIAPSFTGAIDEFIINRESRVELKDKYSHKGGFLLSDVIQLDNQPVTLKNVKFDADTGNKFSDIKYYIRFSDKSFYRDSADVLNNVEWFEFSNQLINNTRAKFIQWKAVLLPGAGGEVSPLLRGVTLEYEKDYPPAKPVGIRAVSENGKIKLKWNNNTERNLKGYKVYYGRRSGFYFSADALQGESPINIGKKNEFELTGLESNVIYYIAVTAYNNEDGSHESDFSDEIFIRVK